MGLGAGGFCFDRRQMDATAAGEAWQWGRGKRTVNNILHYLCGRGKEQSVREPMERSFLAE